METTSPAREMIVIAIAEGSASLEDPETTGALHVFTVGQYMKLDTPERTELLGGPIYDVSPRNELHRYAVRRLGKIYLER